jgi:hypothetical protein
MSAAPIRIVALDLSRLISFLNSVAYAQAALNHTKTLWRPDQSFSQSKAFSAIYSALGYTSPGTVEVTQDVGLIERDRARLLHQHWHAALLKMAHGPPSLFTYLKAMEDVKDYATQSTRGTFRDAARINSEIAGETHKAIERLAKIRLASTLIILPTAVGVGIGATAAGAVGLAFQLGLVSTSYQVIGSFARSVQEAHSARAIAVNTGKPIAEYAADKSYEAVEEAAKKAAENRLEKASVIIAGAKREIGQLSGELGRKISTSKIAKISRKIERNAAELRVATTRSRIITDGMKSMKDAGAVLQLVFLAYDLHEAVEEYRKDIGEASGD